MKKCVLGIMILLIMCCMANSSLCESSVIYSANNGSVHLRAGRSTNSASKGLYFPGTEVLCEEEPLGEWTYVVIGSESGYMKTEFLLRGVSADTIITEKRGTVSKQGAVIRQKPEEQAKEIDRLKGGTILIILGETKDHWYYVQVGENRGYVHKNYVSNRKLMEGEFPFAEATEWTFLSGAGAWSTQLIILPDGSFSGDYHDDDMGANGPGYPNGTRYVCKFSGKFEVEGRIANRVYSARVVSLNLEQKPGEVSYVDGVLEIASKCYGLSTGDRFYLCLSGASEKWITKGMRTWLPGHVENGKILSPVLLNRDEDWGFYLEYMDGLI